MLGSNPIGSSPIASTGRTIQIYQMLLQVQLGLVTAISKSINKTSATSIQLDTTTSKSVGKTIFQSIQLIPSATKSIGKSLISSIQLVGRQVKQVKVIKRIQLELIPSYVSTVGLVDLWQRINSISISIGSSGKSTTSFVTKHAISIKDYIKQKIRISNE
jgi:hypothetical protein